MGSRIAAEYLPALMNPTIKIPNWALMPRLILTISNSSLPASAVVAFVQAVQTFWMRQKNPVQATTSATTERGLSAPVTLINRKKVPQNAFLTAVSSPSQYQTLSAHRALWKSWNMIRAAFARYHFGLVVTARQ